MRPRRAALPCHRLAYQLVSKNNVGLIDVRECNSAKMTCSTLSELRMVAHSLVHDAGHHIEGAVLKAQSRNFRCAITRRLSRHGSLLGESKRR